MAASSRPILQALIRRVTITRRRPWPKLVQNLQVVSGPRSAIEGTASQSEDNLHNYKANFC